MNWRSIYQPFTAIPILLLTILAMVILPLPGWMLDILFTLNIVLAIIVLLVSVSTKKPLDFSVFPTVLLLATLMRLTLNIASTRVVLLEGHSGSDVAGRVIQAFGEVVIGGNYVVGMVVFVILMVINFVVITKGGERISEVAARFTLDALPGKQMAIDADLNAGLIGPDQAVVRRESIAKEADFYGSMDGASKFVRGDAVAGLVILVINLLGGISIGIFQHDLSIGEAFQQFALLTIGDGLVAQIPSLLLAVSAAIIVTRMNDEGDVSVEIGSQLLASPKVLWTVGGIMLFMGLIPGMPTVAFIGFGIPIVYVAWRMQRKLPDESLQKAEEVTEKIASVEEKLSWDALPYPDNLTVELGFRLVQLADKAKGEELIVTLRGVRKRLSEQCGFLLPEVNVRDNLQLGPQGYVIKLNGVPLGKGTVNPTQFLALNGGDVYGSVDGEITQDPAYGLEAVWIEQEDKSKALNMGYSVVDPATVISTHVGKVMKQELPELMVYDDVKAIHKRLEKIAPNLAEALDKALPIPIQLKVFRMLLAEQVSITDIVTIATTLVESSEVTKDPILLAADVRCALQRALMMQVFGDYTEASVFTLSASLEQTLQSSLTQAMQAGKVALDSFPIDPNMLSQFQVNMPLIVEQMIQLGVRPVLLVIPQLRPLLARYAKSFAKRKLVVLSYNEVPDYMSISVKGNLG